MFANFCNENYDSNSEKIFKYSMFESFMLGKLLKVGQYKDWQRLDCNQRII